MKKYFLGLIIFACGLVLWGLLYRFPISQKEKIKADSAEAELVIQTGLKLYDNISFYTQHEEEEHNQEDSNLQKRKALNEDRFYRCSKHPHPYDPKTTDFDCDHITGYYYNFDVPARGVRINYHQSHLWYYGDEENEILPPPKFEQRYLSGNALYGDGRFMLSFFSTGSQEKLTPPDVIHYLGGKFYLTEKKDPLGYYYEIIPDPEKKQFQRYGRLSFLTHPSKDYYYSIFQELRDCWPFCWIDHHEFELFLK